MVNRNIQMKKKNEDKWENLFPLTLNENVFNTNGESLKSQISVIENNISLKMDKEEYKKHIKNNYIFVDDFGAVGDGVTDDTLAIQQALDYASSLGKREARPPVVLSSKEYSITGLDIHTGNTLKGQGHLIKKGTQKPAISLISSLYCQLEDFSITLTGNNQTAILIDTDPNKSSSQLNTFKNIDIEGNRYSGTTSLVIGYAWVNNFYDCNFFRTEIGIDLNNKEANANYFYGCEIRWHTTGESNSIAIKQKGGKANSFQGGVIENHNELIVSEGGSFSFNGIYLEGFKAGRAVKMDGDSFLTFNACLLPVFFSIRNGKALNIVNCEFNRSEFESSVSNHNYPLIEFIADVNTNVLMQGNRVHKESVQSRFGYYKNSSGEYVKRKKSNQNEKYLDKTNPYHGTVNSSTITTKNTLYDEIKLGNPSLNPYNEVQSNGYFKAYQGGIYEIDLSLTISDLTSEKINYISLTLTEVGGDNKSYKLSEKTSNDVLSNNSLFIKTSGIFELEGNREYRLMLQGSANTGHTFSVSSGDYVIRRVL